MVSSLEQANAALKISADTLVDDNMTLVSDIDALVEAAAKAQGTALIEDFFFTNDEPMLVGEDDNILVPPFCIDETGILKFEL